VSDDARKLFLVLLAGAAVAAVMVGLLPKWLGAAAGPETEILTELKRAEGSGITLAVPRAGELVSTKVSYQRISVAVSGDHAVVTATLDFDGELGPTKVSSLGHERVPFALTGTGWEPEAGFAPRLTAVVAALERRRHALTEGDLSGVCFDAEAGQGTRADLEALLNVRNRALKARAWLIRSERDAVTVSEDYRLTGELPERPVDDLGTRRLLLTGARDGGVELCFAAGLL
jgi:hypothetical protein